MQWRTKVVDLLQADDVGVGKGKLLEDEGRTLVPLQVLLIHADEFTMLGKAVCKDIPLQDAKLMVNKLTCANWKHVASQGGHIHCLAWPSVA